MAVNSAKSCCDVDVCQHRNDVCPVMASFSEMAQLAIYISTIRCVLLIQIARVNVSSAEKRRDLKWEMPNYSHVMFSCESRRFEFQFQQCDKTTSSDVSIQNVCFTTMSGLI